MNKDIIKFYQDKSLDIPKLIAKSPPTIPNNSIEAAAVKVYQDIQKGLEIKDISIRSRIYREALGIDSKKYLGDWESFEGIEHIRNENKILKIILVGFGIFSLGWTIALGILT